MPLALALLGFASSHASPAIADDDCFALDVSLLQLGEQSSPAELPAQQRRGGSSSISTSGSRAATAFSASALPANRSAAVASWPSDLAKPGMMSKMYGPLADYITAFGVINSASTAVDKIFQHGEQGRGKWGYGYCVCEICHTVVETLQLKMFQDYGIGFQEQDVYDVRATRSHPLARPPVHPFAQPAERPASDAAAYASAPATSRYTFTHTASLLPKRRPLDPI